jgi:queuine tRNA-ribosyltransferase
MNNYYFYYQQKYQDKHTQARLGVIHTPHGDIHTPAFVPVGTQSTVKSLSPDDLKDLGVNLFFVNTYHAYLRPGLTVIKKFGGLHKFMDWDRPIITDSGGFQIFSLGTKRFAKKNEDGEPEVQLVKISDDGVVFHSHWDGSEHLFTPVTSMEYQWTLGSDIHIAFDDCTPYPVTYKQAVKSLDRTHQWAVKSLEAHELLSTRFSQLKLPYQALYGSVQGSIYQDLRQKSATYISGMDFDGIAIGGVSVGESKSEMVNVLDWVCPLLPEVKPKHLLGVGEIDDIFALVEHGIDTFDCVQPTRLARMGKLYINPINNTNKPINTNQTNPTNKFALDIFKSEFAEDTDPIDRACTCYTCRHFSRAYLHHLFKVRELLAYRLATLHNIHFINTLVLEIRKSIKENRFIELKNQWL